MNTLLDYVNGANPLSYRRLIPFLFDSFRKLNALLKLFTPNFTFSETRISAIAQLTSIISFKKGF